MKFNLKPMLVSAAMTFIIVFCLGMGIFQAAGMEKQIHQLQQEALQAQGELTALEQEKAQEPEQMADHLKKACEAGEQAADLQTKLMSLNSADSSGQWQQTADQLNALFAAGDLPAGSRWYAKNTDARWTFICSCEEEDGQIKGMWKLEDSTLLAYAFASYNPQTGLFEGLRWGQTEDGLHYGERLESEREGISWQEQGKALQETARQAGLVE